MGKINIKNGTPVGSASVCESCCFAQIMRGFRESELLVYCNYPTPSIVVPFKLTECTNHYDKNRPSWKQMEELAIYVSPGRSKPAGFSTIGPSNQENLPEPETINEWRAGPSPLAEALAENPSPSGSIYTRHYSPAIKSLLSIASR